MIREACLQDLNDLVEIENSSFSADRLSRRSFRYLLTRANAATLVYEERGRILGYVTLLFHDGTSLARLYSFAVKKKGRGIGTALLKAVEKVALEHDCISLRLEVRRDNDSAIRLYEKLGYRQFGIRPDYYEDHMEAVRYEKRLVPKLKPDLRRVPYYRQTLDFTCGPSALMMAMKALDNRVCFSRKMELRLWRESTTIFMTSGHGGCGPYGLALSAWRAGFNVELYLNEKGAMFIDSVRSEEKKEVMRLVQEDFLAELRSSTVKVHYKPISVQRLQKKFEQGGVPIVLISSYRIYHEKFPHWVIVTGFDDRYIYVHDPYIDYDKGKTSIDSMNMPILKKDFEHMARYGKAAQKAVLILSLAEEQLNIKQGSAS
ncbi:MAG: peptidase C39 family protein [Granulosicoccaceae bacterium]|jgi:ribosomal-protein-alanine acetyltransferase